MTTTDYVIVGAGPAGCALAARLSEDPTRDVLLLEAGRTGHSPDLRIPAATPRLFRSRYDWAFETEPQDALDGRRVFFPRGRTLGGCSATNMQMYVRGDRDDFDAWELPGWRHADLLPLFERARRAWPATDARDPSPLSHAFVDACADAGIPRNDDFNGARLEGAGPVQVFQRRGLRVTAADAYLRPARRRPNLRVLTGAQVARVVTDGRRAVGVAVREGGRERIVHARREVILCAGAIGSPHLLLLSGIGLPEHLAAHGVPVVHALPGVGQNLQDHVMAPVMWACTKPVTLRAAQHPRQVLRFLLGRRGLLSSNGGEAAAFVRSGPGVDLPDLELVFMIALWHDEGLTPPSAHGFGIGATVLRPQSRGTVSLASADPGASPAIRPEYLSAPGDLALLLRGVELARAVGAGRALDGFRGRELEPGAAAGRSEDVEAWVRTRAQTVYHPVGTCRMGDDHLAVVDPQLRVRGMEGLRVADASVAPTLVRGHTAALATVIGERAADLVRGRPATPAAAPQAVLA